MKELANELAAEHVAQSLDEMRDDTKRDRWQNGERAREQAAAIVSRMVADAVRLIEQEKWAK
jgi:F0F1-type ATP synthase membrane subunit b/b'